jgi:hypothetical protein
VGGQREAAAGDSEAAELCLVASTGRDAHRPVHDVTRDSMHSREPKIGAHRDMPIVIRSGSALSVACAGGDD